MNPIEEKVKALMFGDASEPASAENSIVGPRLLLHLEGIAVLLGTGIAFHLLGYAWSTLVLFILTPDITFLGFIGGKRVGSLIYNLAHTYAGPIAFGVWSFSAENSIAIQASLIWLAHIGMDRMLGYGLKYPSAFTNTHMQRL